MRVDNEDIYIPPRAKERSSFEWLGIITLAVVLGTFITDGIRVLAANVWMNYQLEQLASELRSELVRCCVFASCILVCCLNPLNEFLMSTVRGH